LILTSFMRVPIFQVDAFASRLFAGNPAAVLALPCFPADAVMQAIAAENNLSETAFMVRNDVREGGREGADYNLRWFTPNVEVPLCGHATLASAAVVMEKLGPTLDRVTFHTASGALTVERTDSGYVMNLPVRPSELVSAPRELVAALGAVPAEVFVNQFNYMAVFASAEIVRELAPDMTAVARVGRPGVIVTAPGDEPEDESGAIIASPVDASGDRPRDGAYDFVSRYFAPAKGIPEDPVTGAAHCMLTPYWAKRLGKTALRAFQASRRGGEIGCRLSGDRVELEGACVFYLEGSVEIGVEL
jgi:PhzF family phenazine biosynthesis protein